MSTFQIYINDDEESGGVRLRTYGDSDGALSDITLPNWDEANRWARGLFTKRTICARRALRASGREPGR